MDLFDDEYAITQFQLSGLSPLVGHDIRDSIDRVALLSLECVPSDDACRVASSFGATHLLRVRHLKDEIRQERVIPISIEKNLPFGPGAIRFDGQRTGQPTLVRELVFQALAVDARTKAVTLDHEFIFKVSGADPSFLDDKIRTRVAKALSAALLPSTPDNPALRTSEPFRIDRRLDIELSCGNLTASVDSAAHLQNSRISYGLTVWNHSSEKVDLAIGPPLGLPSASLVDCFSVHYPAIGTSSIGNTISLRPGEKRSLDLVFQSPVTKVPQADLRCEWGVHTATGTQDVILTF